VGIVKNLEEFAFEVNTQKEAMIAEDLFFRNGYRWLEKYRYQSIRLSTFMLLTNGYIDVWSDSRYVMTVLGKKIVSINNFLNIQLEFMFKE
jgi:hypothetical protein